MMYLRFYNRTASLWNERACMGLAIMAASGMVAFIQNLITCFAGEVDFPPSPFMVGAAWRCAYAWFSV